MRSETILTDDYLLSKIEEDKLNNDMRSEGEEGEGSVIIIEEVIIDDEEEDDNMTRKNDTTKVTGS